MYVAFLLLNESGKMNALSIITQNFPSTVLNELLRSQRKEKCENVDSWNKVNFSKENIHQIRNEWPWEI